MAVRLGHLLGANEPRKSRSCVIMATCAGGTLTLLNSIMIYTFRQAIADHFSTDPEVIAAIVQLLKIACLCHFTMVRTNLRLNFRHLPFFF